jgi:hypothetical protein
MKKVYLGVSVRDVKGLALPLPPKFEVAKDCRRESEARNSATLNVVKGHAPIFIKLIVNQ